MSSTLAIKQFSRFCIVGVCNGIVSYTIIFAGMYLAGLSPEISNIAGYAVGLVVSYILNKNYTFNSKKNNPLEILRFLAVFGAAYAVNFTILFLFIHKIGVSKGISQVYAGIVYTSVSFTLNKYYVFVGLTRKP